MSRRLRVSPAGHAGFTIIELMLATTVFGVILLMVTGAVLYMSRAYQHSLYTSATQAAASNLVDTVGLALKFSSGSIDRGENGDGTKSVCIGNRQFLYVEGRQLDGSNPDTKTANAFVTRTRGACAKDAITTSLSGNYNELLGKGMRLSKLNIDTTSSDGAIIVTARVVYGDDDLLCSPAVTDSCTSVDPMEADQVKAAKDLMCRPDKGSEFCAVSELSSKVYRRL